MFGHFFDHSFTWYADVQNKRTGAKRTYYMGGGGVTREDVAKHIESQYPNVKVSTIAQCTSNPTRVLAPVPPEDYEFGHRVAVEKMLKEQKEQEEQCRWYAARPLKLQPIKLKPLPTR